MFQTYSKKIRTCSYTAKLLYITLCWFILTTYKLYSETQISDDFVSPYLGMLAGSVSFKQYSTVNSHTYGNPYGQSMSINRN